MNKTLEKEQQCLYCGKVPHAIDAGFNVKEMPESAKTGIVKYYYDCPSCYKTNYYTQKEDKKSIYELMQLFFKYDPKIFD